MKKYMICVISLLFVIVLLLLPVNIFKNKIDITYELEKEKNITYVYYVEGIEVVGVPIYNLSSNKYTQIKEVFMYLTTKSNSINEKYETYLNLNTKLVSYEVLNDSIYLEVDDSFFKIKEEKTNLILGQILYTYQELGFKNIYLKHNGNILSQVNSIPTYNGINNLAINVLYKANSTNTKTVKVIYSYKDNSKGFINYIINSDIDNLEFITNDLIEFINLEYDFNVRLISVNKSNNYINLKLKITDEEKEITKKIINENLKNVIYDF